MELNETITLEHELQFCEAGNRLALNYLQVSRAVLKKLAVVGGRRTMLVSSVTAPLDKLLDHVNGCPSCNEGLGEGPGQVW
jgi:hypothetical protein